MGHAWCHGRRRKPVGTRGYIDPEYLASGWLGPASDVYGFGVTMMQLLTGVKVTTSGDVMMHQNEIDFAIENHDFTRLVDSHAADWPNDHVSSGPKESSMHPIPL